MDLKRGASGIGTVLVTNVRKQVSNELIKSVQELINSGKYDTGRPQYILHTLMKGKILYLSDQKYLESKLSKPPEIEVVELRQKLNDALERIEELERKVEKLIQTEVELDLNSLQKKLYDPTIEKQKSSNGVFELEKSKDKPIKHINFRAVSKGLQVLTIVTIVATIMTLAFFGTLEGKSRWEDYGINYDQANLIVYGLLYALILELAAWIGFGIKYFISNKRRR